MLEQVSRFLLVLAMLSASALSSCSHMTAQGRQQLAYAHYVKKYSHNRVKQKTKFKKVSMPKPTTEPHSSANTNSDSPQSATTGGEN